MGKNIWIDLDNSPHVSVFKPIINEFQSKGVQLIITARDFNHTPELLDFWGIPYRLIGIHGGKNKIKKIVNLFVRANQLRKYIKNKKIDFAISHGSRTQVVAAKRLGIPSVVMMDYEYTETKIFNYLSKYMLIPKFIPDSRLASVGLNLKKVIRYDGYKEQIYLNSFVPDTNFRKKIGINNNQILVVIRPPGMVGNYHDPKSEKLLIEGIKYFGSFDNVVCLLLTRTKVDKQFIKENIIFTKNIRFLEKPVDGLQLLYNADIVISGGGTMNRESALLGTKTYSIFTGKHPYLDEYLERQEKLIFINQPDDFYNILVKRDTKKKFCSNSIRPNLAKEIVDIIIEKMD